MKEAKYQTYFACAALSSFAFTFAALVMAHLEPRSVLQGKHSQGISDT
jgi:hypothetical protein